MKKPLQAISETTSRHEYLDRRRAAVAAFWDLDDQVVLVGGGSPISIPGGADQTFPFQPHSDYLYLCDEMRHGSVLAFDPQEGWAHFTTPISASERIWEAAVPEPEGGLAITELAGWLQSRAGRPLAVLGCVPSVAASLEVDAALATRLNEQLAVVRRVKDQWEISRIREAAAATAAGFLALRDWIRPGITERALQIELEAAFFRAGADATAFGTIVASGRNASVLHFSPGQRRLAAHDLVLVDAGAGFRGYVADVTRTFAVSGGGTAEFRELYAVVLEAQVQAIRECRAGVEFADLHLAAAGRMAAGLVELGILHGQPDSLVERGTMGLFFPHGLGHMVGLGVRDAGGPAYGRTPRSIPGIKSLRMDLPLEPGFVITIEPGIYFNAQLLGDPKLRAEHHDAVDWERVEALLEFGGIRIEDNVLITDGEPEVLTGAIPKT